jgi:hypothetical protein
MSRPPTLVTLVACLALAGSLPPKWMEEADAATAPPMPEQGAPRSDSTIAAGSISLGLPSGWERVRLPGDPGVTVLRPEGVDDSAVQLSIPPGEEFPGDLMDWVADRWRALPYAKNDEQVGRGTTPAGEHWVMVSARLHKGLEGLKPVFLQVLGDGPRVQPLFWYFRDDESLGRYGPAVDALSQSVRFLPPRERAAPRAVPLDVLVPRMCITCIHTFTGAPPATSVYLVGTWATGTVPGMSGPRYADRRVFTFRADGTYEFSGAMQATGAGTVLMRETGRYNVEGHRLTLERRSGSVDNNGRVRQLGPESKAYQWRSALDLGARQQMLVLRESAQQEWEGFFRR